MKKKPDELQSDRERPRQYTPVGEHSKTKQAMKDECDINTIIKRHSDTGHLTHINPSEPQFGNFASPYDLKSAIDAVHQAQERFQTLPAEIRAAAQNNPVQFLEMLEDPDGQADLVEAGLGLHGPDFEPTEPDPRIPQTGPPGAAAPEAPQPPEPEPPKGKD